MGVHAGHSGRRPLNEVLTTHHVELVGVEGSAKWGAHVAIALIAAPRAVLAEPTLGPAQSLEVYDPSPPSASPSSTSIACHVHFVGLRDRRAHRGRRH